MTSPTLMEPIKREPEPESPPPGMIEYEARTAIRDLIRFMGFEAARDQVAQYLNDEADNKRARQ